jgi:CheY-like chemotaxis protein
MPVVARWEPARTLKANLQARDIPIIGMSAYALDSERGPSSSLWLPPFGAS